MINRFFWHFFCLFYFVILNRQKLPEGKNMSIYSINNPLANGYGINVYSLKKKQEQENAEDPDSQNILTRHLASLAQTRQNQDLQETQENEENAFPAKDNAQLALLVEQIAEELGMQGKITYSSLLAARDSLSAEFQETIQKGLAEKGVAEDADFRLSLDKEGNISVSSNHGDKAKIEQFFKENPSLANMYTKIQTLNQVEEARKMSGTDLKDAVEKAGLLSYTSALMLGGNSALAVNGDGTLTSLMNTGFSLTV